MASTIPKVNILHIGLCQKNINDLHYEEIGKKLHSAFTGCGFVYLLDHGVSQAKIDAIFKASKEFFELPDLEKEKYIRNSKTTQGYVKPGKELLDHLKEEKGPQAFHEIRESFDVVRLSSDNWSPNDPSAQDAPYPDSHVPELRNLFKEVGEQLISLAGRILTSLAISLNQEKNFFTKCHQKFFLEGNMSKLRSLYYPPITGEVAPGVVRCGEHADYGTLTFLFQDDLGGLEVRGSNHQWMQAKPVSGAILVNLGDLMEVFTNGLFPATRHRVVVPKEEIIRKQPRQSFVFFIHPDDETDVKPIDGQVAKLEKYKPIKALQHTLNQFGKTYV